MTPWFGALVVVLSFVGWSAKREASATWWLSIIFEKRGGYLRFLYSAVFPLLFMCSNPASISSSSSFSSCATLPVNWSFPSRNSAWSRLMYIIVFSMLLCPSMCCTCMMSFVA